MNSLSHLYLLRMFCLSSWACRPQSKFAGQANNTGKIEPAVVNDKNALPSTIPVASSNPGIASACNSGAASITQATLLSSGISTKLGTQSLRYELSILNCKDGSAEAIKNQPVLFDLDATFPGGFRELNYTITDTSSIQISTAKLHVVEGSDLFGNTGNFAHYITQSFNYPSKLEKIILEIILDNVQIFPRDQTKTSIDSYLRIGDTQAVTQPLLIKN